MITTLTQLKKQSKTKSESSFFSVAPESAVQLCFTKYLLSIILKILVHIKHFISC